MAHGDIAVSSFLLHTLRGQLDRGALNDAVVTAAELWRRALDTATNQSCGLPLLISTLRSQLDHGELTDAAATADELWDRDAESSPLFSTHQTLRQMAWEGTYYLQGVIDELSFDGTYEDARLRWERAYHSRLMLNRTIVTAARHAGVARSSLRSRLRRLGLYDALLETEGNDNA